MIYFGVVTNINDPEGAGRVQVKVWPFHRDFANSDLPWALVERSTDFGPTAQRGISQHNLIEGSQVTVEFLDQHFQQPIVRGIVPRATDIGEGGFAIHSMKFLNGSEITFSEIPGNEYIKILDNLQNFVLMDKEGITLHVGDSSKEIHLDSKGGITLDGITQITINSDGPVNINTKADTNVESKGSTNIKSEGDTTIESKGNINIKSSGNTTVEASKLSLKNITGPNQLCSLPACLFTGAKHIAPASE